MRFTSVVVAGIFAVAVSAQSSQAATATTSSVASATTTDPAQASMLNCLNTCGDDVDCKADCITVPSPSDEQANDTIDCVAQCPQGKGTEADNAAYGSCVSDCIGKYFYTSTGALAGATRTGTASGSGATGTGSGGSGSSGTGTGTGSSSSSTSTSEPNGAAAIRTGASAVGLVGFLVAFLAL
jgi:hypothetical protein